MALQVTRSAARPMHGGALLAVCLLAAVSVAAAQTPTDWEMTIDIKNPPPPPPQPMVVQPLTNHSVWLDCMANIPTCRDLTINEDNPSVYRITGTIPSEIGSLTALTLLKIYGTSLYRSLITGTVPTELGLLTNLRTLYFQYNDLTGTVPSQLGNLTMLTDLDLYSNGLHTLPSEIGALTNMRTMQLGQNHFNVLPVEFSYMNATLNSLYFNGNGLSVLPTEIGLMTVLSTLAMSGNSLTTIPDEIANMTAISYLNLYGNLMQSALIPTYDIWAGIGDTLSTLNLGNNQLLGPTLPSVLGQLTSLRTLYLNDGQYESMPTEIGSLQQLTYLTMQNNNVTGYPASFWTLPLTYFDFDSGGEFSGAIPSEFGLLTTLATLYMRYNGFSGYTLPSEFGAMSALSYLDMSYTSTEEFSLGFFDMPAIKYLNLDRNEHLGAGTTKLLPSEMGKLDTLTHLIWTHSTLSGTIPTEWGMLTSLSRIQMNDNKVIGPLPTEIGTMARMVRWEMYINDLNQALPTEIGQMTALREMHMQENFLQEGLPSEIGSLTALSIMKLYDNSMSVAFPTEIGKLTSLATWEHYSNKLVGPIPTEFGMLGGKIDLHDNLIDGSLPTEIGEISVTYLDMHVNDLSGPMPSGIGQQQHGSPTIRYLDLCTQTTGMTGSLPTEIGLLTGLTYLHLCGNHFTGTLPAELANTKIGTLDISGSDGISGVFDCSFKFSTVADFNIQTCSPTTSSPTTSAPTVSPTTKAPTMTPTTRSPTTSAPSVSPTTKAPTMTPTTRSPTTSAPSVSPTTKAPTTSPTTRSPTTSAPTVSPTTKAPTMTPTTRSPTTSAPTESPTTKTPTASPTTLTPTTVSPTGSPTTVAPTSSPTTLAPTLSPTTSPTTKAPTESPTTSAPTGSPTASPTTLAPTGSPTTLSPTLSPTFSPTNTPTWSWTFSPSVSPTTLSPTTISPTAFPTMSPTPLIVFDLQVFTMDQKGADASNVNDGADLNVTFYQDGVWTEPQRFFLGEIKFDDQPVVSMTYALPGKLPEIVRLIGSPERDDYGFWKVQIAYTCPYILVEHPNGVEGDKEEDAPGFWINGDDSPSSLDFPVGNATTCAPTPPPTYATVINLTASTSTAEDARMTDNHKTVNVSFYANEQWSDNMTFFEGEVDYATDVSVLATVATMPTKIRITCDADMDPWSYWKIWFTFTSPITGDSCEVVLIEDDFGASGHEMSQSGWESYWIGEDATTVQSFDVTADMLAGCGLWTAAPPPPSPSPPPPPLSPLVMQEIPIISAMLSSTLVENGMPMNGEKCINQNSADYCSSDTGTSGFGTDDPWLMLDLNSTMLVSKLVMSTRYGFEDALNGNKGEPNGYVIYVGNSTNPTDNPVFRTVVKTGAFYEAKAMHVEDEPEGDMMCGQYIFIYLPGNNRLLTLSEIQVYGPGSAYQTCMPGGLELMAALPATSGGSNDNSGTYNESDTTEIMEPNVGYGYPSIHSLTVYVATSTQLYASQEATTGVVNMSILEMGEWTEPETFFAGAVATGQIVSKFKHVRSVPTAIMLTAHNSGTDDNWSDAIDDYAFWKIWIKFKNTTSGEETTVVLLEDPLGEAGTPHPDVEWNDDFDLYWLGGDDSPDEKELLVSADGLPAGLVQMGAGSATHELTLYASTNDADQSGMRADGLISVEFKVNGVWSAPMKFLDGRINKGQNVSRTFNTLEFGPEEIRLTASDDTDDWGFKRLWMTFKNMTNGAICELVIAEDTMDLVDADPDEHKRGHRHHEDAGWQKWWIGGIEEYDDALMVQTFRVESANCTRDDDEEEFDFPFTGDTGFCYPYHTVTVYAATSEADDADISDKHSLINTEIKVKKPKLKIEEDFWIGKAKNGQVISKEFQVQAMPKKIELQTTRSNDNWGFWKVWVTFVNSTSGNSCTIVLREDEEGAAGHTHPREKKMRHWHRYWMGEHGGRKKQRFHIHSSDMDECNAVDIYREGRATMEACIAEKGPTHQINVAVSKAKDADGEDKDGKLWVQYLVEGEWTELDILADGKMKSGKIYTADAYLPIFPDEVRVTCDPNMDAVGFWKVWISHIDPDTKEECDVVLVEDPNGISGTAIDRNPGDDDDEAEEDWELYWIGNLAQTGEMSWPIVLNDSCMGTHQGVAYDGYLGNCSISLLHPEENVTVSTSSDGTFSLTGSADAVQNAILVLTPDLDGCGDSKTDASLSIKLMSPPGSVTLSPLSTLIVSVMLEGNMTEDQADEKIRMALGLPWTGQYLHNFDAIESIVNSVDFITVDHGLQVMVALSKVHLFILTAAVMIAGEWAPNVDDPALRNATFIKHMNAGDVAMSELAQEIVAVPLDTPLNVSNPEFITDVLVQAHESVRGDGDITVQVPSFEVIKSAAGCLGRMNDAIEAALRFHTRDSDSVKLMDMIDFLALQFQEAYPVGLSEMVQGVITTEQFDEGSSSAVMNSKLLAMCQDRNCVAENYIEARALEIKGVPPEAALAASGAVPAAPPSDGSSKKGWIQTWAGILGMVLFALFGCLGGCGAMYYFIKKGDMADWDMTGSPRSVDMAPTWKTNAAAGSEKDYRIDIPTPRHSARDSSYATRNAHRHEETEEETSPTAAPSGGSYAAKSWRGTKAV